MFKKQPLGLYILSLSNVGERFGYYTMLAIFLLYLQAKFGFDASVSGQIYAIFLALVYFMPVVGGWVADRWNFSKTVVTGMIVKFAGYAIIAIPTAIRSDSSLTILIAALVLIAIGTGFFKGNLQVMAGDLYNDPKYASQRDAGFSLFYMIFNIGAMFAPMAATALTNLAMDGAGLTYVAALPQLCNAYLDTGAHAGEIVALAHQNGMEITGDISTWAEHYISTLTKGYCYGFALACLAQVFSFVIYLIGRRTFLNPVKKQATAGKSSKAAAPELSPKQVRERVTALLLVFAAVIFFWMAFHQNGTTLTEFAKSCTSSDAFGWTRIGFNVWALALIIVGVFSMFEFIQGSKKERVISALVFVASVVGISYIYATTPEPVSHIQPQEYQQFNPFFVIALTPVSLALFGWLAKRKKEPSAPRKIGIGMVLGALGFVVMGIASIGIKGISASVSPNWLITTYLILTLAELMLSPMGISFVSSVAPPKLKGSMMGGWFAATAIGNYLVSIPMLLWGKINIVLVWGLLAGVCAISALFIFAIIKRLERATSDQPETPAVKAASNEPEHAEAELM